MTLREISPSFLGTSKLPPLQQDFQNILDKMADNGLSQSMLEKERTLISKLYRTAIGWRVVDANLHLF